MKEKWYRHKCKQYRQTANVSYLFLSIVPDFLVPGGGLLARLAFAVPAAEADAETAAEVAADAPADVATEGACETLADGKALGFTECREL